MRHRYRAFLSYSHKDAEFARWLHRALERWRIDSDLVGRKTPVGEVPRHLRPIFRDRDDFAGGASLKTATEAALRDSDFLVVICSPNSANSAYVNEEVRLFKAMGRADRVIPIILAGEPGGDDDECFPPAVTYTLDAAGELSDDPAEPIAADARDEGDGRHRAAAKVAAGLLGLTFDEIAKRAENAQRRRSRIIAAVAVTMTCLAVAAGYLAWLANDRRIAAEANYAAAKTAAGQLFQSVAEDLSEIDDLPLDIHRRILGRADVIFERLKSRAPDDLEIVADQARTLGIFAAAFRDQEDWQMMGELAARSEVLIERLIATGDRSENWPAYRAEVRIARLSAYYQTGELESDEARALQEVAEGDIALLRDVAGEDARAASTVTGWLMQDAFLRYDTEGPTRSAELMQEALEYALSIGHPLVEEDKISLHGGLVVTGLPMVSRFFRDAGDVAGSREALDHEIDVLQGLIAEVADPLDLRTQMAGAYFNLEALERAAGDPTAAERAARRGQYAIYALVPWQGVPLDELRTQADLALSNAEDLRNLEHMEVARGWYHGCAGMYERVLEDDAAELFDAYQMLRCMEKVERTFPDDLERRKQALFASRDETERLVGRFPDLVWMSALVEGRHAEILEEEDNLAEAAATYGRTGEMLASVLPETGADRTRVYATGETFGRQADILYDLGETEAAVLAYRRAAEIFEAAHGGDDSYADGLTRMLYNLGVLEDRPTDRWRRIIEIVDAERRPSEIQLDRREYAANALSGAGQP